MPAVLVLGSVCVLAAAVPAAGARTAGTPKPPKITVALQERQLTQQALLIGIASNVLQSQFQLDFYLSPGEVGHCEPLQGGGSDEVRSATTNGRVTTGVNVLYYDTGCTEKYMTQRATYTAGTSNTAANRLSASNTYYGLTGKKLGVMGTKETAQSRGESTELLNGLGTFRVTGLTTPVSLGVGCTLAEGQASLTGACQGGIAQDFPAQHYSLGSVTPVNLMTKGTGLSFSATSATRRAGSLHALSIAKGKPQRLTLTGTGANTGSSSISGRAGAFSLFPPAPTGWTVTDKPHHLTLNLKVSSGAVRNLTGAITSTSTKKKLATIMLDQSGTGHLHYVGGPSTAITSWILTK